MATIDTRAPEATENQDPRPADEAVVPDVDATDGSGPAGGLPVGESADERDGPPTTVDGDEEHPPPLATILRPLLAAALAAGAAGFVAAGIFGSWGARLTGVLGAFGGAGWALVTLRSKRPALVQAVFPLVAVVVGAVSLLPRGESPGDLVSLAGEAIDSGRLFRPPVPYDPGWTPILLVLMALVGFAAAWVATGLGRPNLAVALPLPIVGLTAITQPEDGQFIAGAGALVAILAALAVLFGGDSDRASQLGAQFELKRALRGVLLGIPLLGLLFAFNSASFLFPDPVYDPSDQPQRPRPIPLSAAVDRVLFEVATDSGLTGPWRTGVLDIYDEEAWKLPPLDRSRLERIPADGQLDDIRADARSLTVTITTRDLGDSAVLPGVAGATRIDGDTGGLVFDPRTHLIRVPEGRAPRDFSYTLQLPRYPTDDQLTTARPGAGGAFAETLAVPDPPPAIRRQLAEAPPEPWARIDFLRQRLLANVVAAGGGSPVDVPPGRVAELFEEDARATPFEIVAAEALLARWAGVPSRVGFGFDGLNPEDDVLTVRPRDSAQWLEVWFDGFGWVPLIGAPQQAEAALDADPFARFNPLVEASDDVAVEIYLLFELQELRQLYEQIRAVLLQWAPVLAALALAWLVWPFFAKIHRRAKRRRWAARLGPRAQIAVEYAELRDLATDLNVADIYSTPLEYIFEVKDDEEHVQLAWLVARALYGDLAGSVTDEDVRAAESMSASVRRRLMRAQPVQSQVTAYLSRASLHQPYSTEVPNVAMPRRPRLRLPGVRRHRRPAIASATAGRNT